jgi:CP family cyanate transporter-like MFS transporter
MAVVLAALLATGLARALAPGYELILVLTLAIGALIGLGQSQPPVLARLTSLAPQIGSLALTIGLVGSSVAVAAVAVPLSTTFGGWRWAVALVTLPVVASLIAWLAIVRPRATTANAERAHLPWRDRVAWLLAACFGLQGALYTSLTTWLPEMFVEQGWDEASAGALVSALNLFALISNVGLLLAGTRLAATSLAVAVVSVTSLAAAVGLAAGLPPILPVALMGVSLGAVLPLLVTLAIRRAPSAADAGALTAMMFTLGYVTAGLGPVIVGVARDASGAFALPSWLLVADALALVVVAIRVHRAAASARGRPGDEYPTAGTHVSEMST